MARPLRIEFSGALYHITSRGDGRGSIYSDDEDRELFLSLLGDTCERFNWRCHAYCLMGNHYHLLVETLDGNLSKGMRHLNGVYTQRFNRRHHRVGHVYQGRYKAILVDKESYLLELARYIVLNPVRARMVRLAKAWPWSSYRATAVLIESPDWLQVDWLLSVFAKRKNVAADKYMAFVQAGKGLPSPFENLKNQVFLGDDEFVQDMLCKLDLEQSLEDVPKLQRRAPAKSLASYEQKFDDRNTAICQAYASGGYSLKEVGEYFGLHYSRVSRIISGAKDKT